MEQGYYTVPPLLRAKCVGSQHEPRPNKVRNLKIGRLGFGEIYFAGETDVSDVEICDVVKFGHKSVEVYPSDEPAMGQGLNRPALVSFYNVWPLESSSDSSKFTAELVKQLELMGAGFVSYDSKLGHLTFSVKHFSKYGLSDSDEELEVAPTKPKETVPKQVQETIKPPDQSFQQIGKKLKTLGDDSNQPKFSVYEDSMHLELDFSDSENLIDECEPPEMEIFSPLQQAVIASQFNSVRIAGMKASLFSDDYQETDMELTLFKDTVTETASPILPKALTGRSSKMETKIVEPVDFLENFPLLNSTAHIQMDGRFYGSSKYLRKLTKYSKSYFCDKHNLFGDIGCLKGQSFRIGWGPEWQFVHLGEPLGSASEKKDTFSQFSLHSVPKSPKQNSGFLVHKAKLESLNMETVPEMIKENLIRNLEIQLNFNRALFTDDIPYFEAVAGVDLLHSHAQLTEEQTFNLNETKQMWDLCVALWGNLPSGNTEAKNTYNYRDDRKSTFSNWLMQSTLDRLQQEIRTHLSNIDDYLPTLFSHMTGRQIPEAATLAFKNRDFRLYLLLAQASSSSVVRIQLQRMLQNWHQYKIDNYIDKERLKIYALMAGLLIWNPDQEVSINCCENLDWKRALAIHLWYHCPGTASIADAVAEFDSSFQGTSPNGKYSQPPYPSYIENDPEMLMTFFAEELDFDSESKSVPYDVCYYLLKLYCDRTTRLDKLLAPLTYSASHLDYSTGWLLHQVLDSLGYNHLPQYQTHQLHNNFATQLESLGLWEWSIFVLLHLPNPLCRKSAIMEYLYRHISLATNELYQSKEKFLVEKLNIPIEWIYSAKAVFARAISSPRDEAWCLLKSSNWNECHRIIVDQIASDCIINEEFSYLKPLLEELSIPERSATITNWAHGGEVCLDYLNICESVDRVLRGEISAYDLEALQPKLISLGRRLDNLKCDNARDTLCQSEMAKKTATLLRAVLTLQRAREGSIVGDQTLTVLELSQMPMPEDYALQELRAITRAYMLDMTNT